MCTSTEKTFPVSWELTTEEILVLSQGVDMVIEDCENVILRPQSSGYVESMVKSSKLRKDNALKIRYLIRRLL